MRKIGILTFHWADDFGGMLQAYALKHFLNNSGLGRAEIIPYETAILRGRYWLIPYRPRHSAQSSFGSRLKREARFVLKNLVGKLLRMQKMGSFRRKYLTDKRRIPSARKLKNLPYDLIVLGSDQIWNPDITYRLEKPYFGAFSKDPQTVTVSYAASLGKPALDAKYTKEFRQLLRSVDVISVREESSVPYVQEQSGKNVHCMPDPTLLLTRREWETIAVAPEETNYVLLHHTEYNEDLARQAVLYAKEHHLKVISLKSINMPDTDIQVRFDIGPAEFLGYIQNASCIFTNSFHATVFSLIFEKSFCCTAHSTLGSRTNDLLTWFGFADRNSRVISSACHLGTEEKLKELRDQAYHFFLKNTAYHKAGISPNCKGCGACVAVCPQNAILMKTGQDGFAYPYINEQLCNHCGKCEKLCPDNKPVHSLDSPLVYGCKCKAEEIRSRSTSGGVFYLLAEQTIRRGGCVYGVILNQSQEACHVCAETLGDVQAMQGAKYVESKLGDCYAKIQKQLQERRVLFTGTPCQVAGLKAFVGDHPNLYTIDIVCHGVASPKVFASYMHWLESSGEIADFHFRSKKTGWHTSSVSYLQNGAVHTESMGQNPYTKLYFRGLISRESCHTCQYASFHRCSDMTIGDYWGIEKVKPEFDDNKGVSLVIVHSEKGRAMFAEISSKTDWFPSDKEHCLQPQLQMPAARHKNRDNLMQDLDDLPFDALFGKYYLLSTPEQIKKRIQSRLF